MNEGLLFQLNCVFDYAGDISNKFVSFLRDKIKIENDNLVTIIKYTEISKITYDSKSVKISTKDGKKIKIPCTSSDTNKIKTLLKAKRVTEIRNLNASAVVHLGDMCFIVPVKSNDIKILKLSVLQRIAEHFYPACDTSAISPSMVAQIELLCKIGKNKLVRLITTDDVDAALCHMDGKLKLYVSC